MPGHESCCAFGCTNRRSKPECKARNVSFFSFPKDMEKRLEWVRRVNRENLRIDDVAKNTKLCSDHSSGGQPSQEQPYPCFFKHKLFPLCGVGRKRRVSPFKEQPKAKRIR